MKKITTLFLILLSFFTKAQTYNPSGPGGTPLNRPIALTGKSDGARTYLYDNINFTYRPFVSVSEANSYITGTARVGHFYVVVNTGGTLLNGVITGGTNSLFVWLNGIADSDLVPLVTASGGSTNTSVGNGYKVAINGTNLVKSFVPNLGSFMVIDSLAPNVVTVSIDTLDLFIYNDAHHPYKPVVGSPLQVSYGVGGAPDTLLCNNCGAGGAGSGPIIWYTSTDSLKAYKPANGTIGYTASYQTLGDNGGARYQYNASSTATGDNMIVLVPTAGGTGRWILAPQNNMVSTYQLGIFGSSNQTAKLQIAINYQAGIGKYFKLIWSQTYYHTDLYIPTNTNIDGIDASIAGSRMFAYSGQVHNLFYHDSASGPATNISIRNMTLDGQQTYSNGAFAGGSINKDSSQNMIFLFGVDTASVTGLRFINAHNGVFFRKLSNAKFDKNESYSLGQSGYYSFYDSSSHDIEFSNFYNHGNGYYDAYDLGGPAHGANIGPRRNGQDYFSMGGRRIKIHDGVSENNSNTRWYFMECQWLSDVQIYNLTLDGKGKPSQALSIGGLTAQKIFCQGMKIYNVVYKNVYQSPFTASDSIGSKIKYPQGNFNEVGTVADLDFHDNYLMNTGIEIRPYIRAKIYKNNILADSLKDRNGGNKYVFAVGGADNGVTDSYSAYIGDNTIIAGDVINYVVGGGDRSHDVLFNNNNWTYLKRPAGAHIAEWNAPTSGSHSNIQITNDVHQNDSSFFTAYYNITQNSDSATAFTYYNNDYTKTNITKANQFQNISGRFVVNKLAANKYTAGGLDVILGYVNSDTTVTIVNPNGSSGSISPASANGAGVQTKPNFQFTDSVNKSITVIKPTLAPVNNSNTVGITYDSSTWSNTNYFQASGNFTTSSGKIQVAVDNGTGQSLLFPRATMLDREYYQYDFTPKTLNTSNFGWNFGLLSLGSNSQSNLTLYCYLNLHGADTNYGKILIVSYFNGTPTNYFSTGHKIASVSVGDSLTYKVWNNDGVFTFTAINNTTHDSVTNTLTRNYLNSGGTGVAHNTAYAGFFTGGQTGSTCTINRIISRNDEPVNAPIVDLGYSIDNGSFAGSVAGRFATQAKMVIAAGPGDISAMALAHVYEVWHDLKPKSVFLTAVQANDISFGISSGTWQANMQKVHDTLVAHGISVIWMLATPRTGLDITAGNTWITINYPGQYIDLYTPLKGTGTDMDPTYNSGDGVHPNIAGHNLMASTIINSALYKAAIAGYGSLAYYSDGVDGGNLDALASVRYVNSKVSSSGGGGGGGGGTPVTNADGSITVASQVVSLNTAHSNTFTADQTFPNIGVGGTTPAYRFDGGGFSLPGPSTRLGGGLFSQSVNGTNHFLFANAGYANSSNTFYHIGTDPAVKMHMTGNNLVIGFAAAGTNGATFTWTDAIAALGSGHVLLGNTVTDDSMVHVGGGLHVDGGLRVDNIDSIPGLVSGPLQIQNGKFVRGQSASSQWVNVTGGISYAGKVAIGIAAPRQRLDLGYYQNTPQLQAGRLFMQSFNSTNNWLFENASYNGANYVYDSAGAATKIALTNGNLVVGVAASGTAGGTITWHDKFGVLGSGIYMTELPLGNTSMTVLLHGTDSLTYQIPVSSLGSGFTNPMTTTGDIIYSSSGSTPARLGIGTSKQHLVVVGGVPAWRDTAAAGTNNLYYTNLSGASATGNPTAYTTANDGVQHTYSLAAGVDITSFTSGSVTVTATYTRGGTTRTASFYNAGGTTAALGATGASNFPVLGSIKADANTNIQFTYTVTGTLVYTYEGSVQKIN